MHFWRYSTTISGIEVEPEKIYILGDGCTDLVLVLDLT